MGTFREVATGSRPGRREAVRACAAGVVIGGSVPIVAVDGFDRDPTADHVTVSEVITGLIGTAGAVSDP